jgi:hypothetical protein
MLTFIILPIVVVFLVIIGVWGYMAKDKARERQSGSPGTASEAKQGRAPGLD